MAGIARAASRRLAGLTRPGGGFSRFTTAAIAAKASGPAPFHFQPLFESDPANPKAIPSRKITDEHVSVLRVDGREVLKVEPEALRLVAQEGMTDIAHLLRPGHLAQLRAILDDPEASDNDRFVALELLKNANIAAGMVLPGCQDTGTAIIMGKKGQNVWTEGDDAAHLSRGVYDTYVKRNLRYRKSRRCPCSRRPTPGATCPRRSICTPRTATSTTSTSWPRGAGARTRHSFIRKRRRCSTRNA